jgi:acyl-CoA reductase-like NAD-dependent aldehyde dehydrogenase
MGRDLRRDERDSRVQFAGSTHFAELIKDAKSTPIHEIDDHLQAVESHKAEWARLDAGERILLLDEIQSELWSARDALIQSELQAKGIPSDSFGAAEEWVILAEVFRAIRQIQSSLMDIRRQGHPAISGHIESGQDGRSVLHVFPHSIWDRLIFLGMRADVWTKPGITPGDVLESQATRYRDLDNPGGVALVLGGGNAAMLPFCDTFHKLFVDLQVVVLKMNPVNAHIGPMIERSLRGLIQRGFLAVVYGGADVGEYLSNHPLVEEIHMTGSDKTYEAIVFGTGPEGRRRKLDHKPLNNKPFTCELGNVSPVIVVPGPWAQSDIDEYAKHIATWIVANAGFTCHTPRVIMQHKSWPRRNDLTTAIRLELEKCPTRKAYYPGAYEIHRDFVAAYPDALLLGEAKEDHLPWTILPDVDPNKTDAMCFHREAFGGLCAEVSLDTETIEAYLDHAVEFANRTLWGTLCATLIVHPSSLKQLEVAEAIDRAIARLRYGTVAVNVLPFYAAYSMVCPWGAIPPHATHNIQSGKGKNFNFLMLDHVEKVVLRAPFKRLDPLTVRSKRPQAFAKKLTAFEAYPSWIKLADLLLAALRC